MTSVLAALLLLVALASPVTAAHPRCSVAPADSNLRVTATGLARDTEYSMWWSISAVDDGPASYYAGTSAHPSDHHGHWWADAFVNGRSGFWYFHVSIPGTEFHASVATCEFVG